MPTKTDGREPSQKELQRKIGQTRDSLRTTVEAIQDKAEQQYESVRQTVSRFGFPTETFHVGFRGPLAKADDF